MIDWHSHILPGIDDGSGSIEESLALLKMQREQGADTVIATPHFFAGISVAFFFVKSSLKKDAFTCIRIPLS